MLFMLGAGLLIAGTLAPAQTTIYVATNGTGDGTSWAAATNSLQDAIAAISASDPTNTVWVSNGVYAVGGLTNFPTGSAVTTRVAIMKAITVRSFNNDPTNTIIKGAWDPVTTNGQAAVRCAYLTNGASLIGFTLTNGATATNGVVSGGGVSCHSTNTVISNCLITGNAASSSAGGVIYGTLYNCSLIGNRANFYAGGAYRSTLFNCTLRGNSTDVVATPSGGGGAALGVLSNCTLVNNYSANYGGGAYQSDLDNCTLTSNSAAVSGGGVAGYTTWAATLTNCTLIGNTATVGGGADRAKLYNCTLTGNRATSAGSGGGGAYNSYLYNCTVASNWASGGVGGGTYFGFIYNCAIVGNRSQTQGGGADVGTLYNCTIVGNSSVSTGGGVNNATLYNCISWGNNKVDATSTATFMYSCGVGYTNGGSVSGNITNDPLFITNGSGYGTNHVAGNYRLRSESPPLNAGTNFAYMTNSADVRSKDLDGNRRIDNFSRQVDMGCYELMPSGTMFIMQ